MTGHATTTVDRGTGSPSWLQQYVGPLSVWLKRRWILPIATAVIGLAVVGAQVVPKDSDGNQAGWVTAILWILGSVAVILVFLDKLADSVEAADSRGKEESLEVRARRLLRASEESARNGVSDLNTMVEAAHEVAFLEGAARNTQMAALRKAMVEAAMKAVGPGSRATYYSLEGLAPSRRLVNPIHAVGYGRDDRPYRPFLEKEDAHLSLWQTLERSDTECRVESDDDEVVGLDWSRKSYKTFVNIPVRSRSIVFGMLSVNSAHREAIGQPQRATLIAMARTLALVESMIVGSRTASALDAAMSAPPNTLKGIEQLEKEAAEGSNGNGQY